LTYVGDEENTSEESREHSSGIESSRMRGSEAGHASGQGLIAGPIIGQGLLTRQAEYTVVPPIHRVSWLDPIDDGSMIRASVAQWNRARLRSSLRRRQLRQQHQQGRSEATTQRGARGS